MLTGMIRIKYIQVTIFGRRETVDSCWSNKKSYEWTYTAYTYIYIYLLSSCPSNIMTRTWESIFLALVVPYYGVRGSKGEGAMNRVVGCNPCSVDLQSPQSRGVRGLPAFLLGCLKQFFYPQCFFEACNHQFQNIWIVDP